MPSSFKIAIIIPIYKFGCQQTFNNYRTISVLPPISKIVDKLVCNRLIDLLDKNNILYQHQYGFRSNHSTIHPILHLLKYIANANDKPTKDVTIGIFIDLSEAFDTINHNTLLKKLQFYGIRGLGNKWFSNYLS